MNFYCQYDVKANCMDQAGAVSSDIKRKLKERNIDKKVIRMISIASYEAEINIVIHSNGGQVFALFEDEFVELKFIDCGPGIEDIDSALEEGYSTANNFARENGFGAGLGLPNIKSVADEFYIDSSPEGTNLKVRFYLHEKDE